ncbi:MAG: pyruvate, phosphate dikinase [Planctomycetaceae bacterium]|nr:pyruvate, phosphate dikinase [Planctomycetaceae bacterium]
MASKKKSKPSKQGKGAKSGKGKKSAKAAKTGKVKTGKMVFYFGETKCEGHAGQKMLLGGKGANLADMVSIGLPVPPGFTITTDTCAAYYDCGGKLPKGLMDDVRANIRMLEKELGKKFGSDTNPLLVSVRSGAAVSMPGMMDTVLNLGLTDKAVEGLAKGTGNRRFAFDAYRRLINMFGDVVMGVDHHKFEHAFSAIKTKYGVKEDTQVPTEGLEELVAAYKKVYKDQVGADFPQDPLLQLEHAIKAVFSSWNGDRAIEYRRIQEIKGLNGTAVNVQAMAYGNMGDTSGTGVAFTRDNTTGENVFYGEFLVNAQGEDVVAGIRTPEPIAMMEKRFPKAYAHLMKVRAKLEKHYKDMQDIEFTVENGKLFMLQTRTGKRTAQAAVRIAVEMVKEKLIDEKTAIKRIPAGDLTQLLLPYFAAADKKGAVTVTRGIGASPGAATGKLAFTAAEAVERAHKGEKVLLVRKETSPEDVAGMHSAVGILTSTGGKTSHAAVVAVGWGKCCVVGAGELSIDEKAGKLHVNGRTFGRDDVLSIDGATGEVMVGAVKATIPEKISGDFAKVMDWSTKHAEMKVRTNADSPEDARRAREFGAVGIGLCRTEHMFFGGDRMDGLPVTVRLLDPPLHEFVPHEEKQQAELAREMGLSLEQVKRRVSQLHEANPMLGHRGCRLAITYPEILRMQIRAIVEAAIECRAKKVDARPEIMHPLVGTKKELALLRKWTEETIQQVCAEKGVKVGGKNGLDIPIGTMIEIPRAAVTADEIAECADFFSYGTNDLTQMTFGYSRDDIGSFLPAYLEKGMLEKDPFQSIDTVGVGGLVKMACEKGRAVAKAEKKAFKLGVCGEHGGDPASIAFFQKCGLDYVSCSPFRVPVARLAAAQAALKS